MNQNQLTEKNNKFIKFVNIKNSTFYITKNL